MLVYRRPSAVGAFFASCGEFMPAACTVKKRVSFLEARGLDAVFLRLLRLLSVVVSCCYGSAVGFGGADHEGRHETVAWATHES